MDLEENGFSFVSTVYWELQEGAILNFSLIPYCYG